MGLCLLANYYFSDQIISSFLHIFEKEKLEQRLHLHCLCECITKKMKQKS